MPADSFLYSMTFGGNKLLFHSFSNMFNDYILDLWYLSQPLNIQRNFDVFFLNVFFPINGNVICGVITSNKHEWN